MPCIRTKTAQNIVMKLGCLSWIPNDKRLVLLGIRFGIRQGFGMRLVSAAFQ
jgi:hypothetical protein